jgi:hypothetical protein
VRTWSLFLLIGLAAATPPGRPVATASPRDGQRDFDFEIGSWKTQLSRRLHPLTGSTTWVAYEGTSVVRKVWNGRANLVELDVEGPAGRIQGLSLRLYNPESRQWSLNFSNSAGGTLSPPTIGGFRDGRGEFYSQETLDGRAILVRFVISDITADSCHFEQAFSDDGGKSWEVNWIATDSRVKDAAFHEPSPARGDSGLPRQETSGARRVSKRPRPLVAGPLTYAVHALRNVSTRRMASAWLSGRPSRVSNTKAVVFTSPPRPSSSSSPRAGMRWAKPG